MRKRTPLTPEGKKHKSEYDQKYARAYIVRKYIPFNKTVAEDVAILDWLDRQGTRKVTGYVKDLIREDMRKSGE